MPEIDMMMIGRLVEKVEKLEATVGELVPAVQALTAKLNEANGVYWFLTKFGGWIVGLPTGAIYVWQYVVSRH